MSDDKRTERIMFTATTETKEFLKDWASKEGRTISNLVERIVLDAIADKQREDKWRKHNHIWRLKRSPSCIKYTWHCRCVSLRKIFSNDRWMRPSLIAWSYWRLLVKIVLASLFTGYFWTVMWFVKNKMPPCWENRPQWQRWHRLNE